MVESTRPRAFLLQNGLRGASSHFLQETRSWHRNLRSAGFEVTVLSHVDFRAEAEPGLDIRPTFSIAPDSTVEAPPVYRHLRTFLEGSALFGGECRNLDLYGPQACDLILIPYATAIELMGLATWIERQQRNGRPLPGVAALVHRPDFDWEWDAASRTLKGELSGLGYACFRLRQACTAGRLALLTTTSNLAEVLNGVYGETFAAGSAPLDYPPLPDAAPGLPPYDFAFVGQMRPEKGGMILAAIVREYLAARPEARIALQLDAPGNASDWLEDHASIADDPRIDWFEGPLDADAFAAMLQNAGTILIPCDAARYQLRLSGVFCEAVAAGRPVVVAGPTWMSERMTEGHGAGMAVRRPSASLYAHALLRIRTNLPEVIALARERSARWRREQSMERLVSIILSHLAAA